MKKTIALILCFALVGFCGCQDKPMPEKAASEASAEAQQGNVKQTAEQVVKPAVETPVDIDDVEPVVDAATQAEIDVVKTLIKKSHEAVCNDDVEMFADCFVKNEKMKSFLDSIFAVMKKQYELEEAIFERFGEEGLDLFCDPQSNPDKPEGLVMHASFMCPPKDEPWWDDPDVEIDIEGETGTFYNPWANTYTPLRKESGQWLFDFMEIPDEALPAIEQMQVGMVGAIDKCLELLKQEETRVYDLNAEFGKAFFGGISGQNENE